MEIKKTIRKPEFRRKGEGRMKEILKSGQIVFLFKKWTEELYDLEVGDSINL